MKKFIVDILKFGSIGTVIYILGVIICGEFFPGMLYNNLQYDFGANDYIHYKLEELKEEKEYDIVFVGSSHCYRTFDTRLFQERGFSSINLGSKSQSHIQTNVWLKDFIDQMNPKLLIYEVYPIMFSVDGIESTVDMVNNEYPLNSLAKTIWQQKHLKVINSIIFRRYREIFFGNYRDYVKENFGSRYIDGGFVEKVEDVESEYNVDSMYVDILDVQLKAFKQNVSLLKDKGVPYVLVEAPVTTQSFDHMIGADIVRDTISKYGDYINFNTISNLDDHKHFFDHDHLNQEGVEVFIPSFIDYLEDRGVLPKEY